MTSQFFDCYPQVVSYCIGLSNYQLLFLQIPYVAAVSDTSNIPQTMILTIIRAHVLGEVVGLIWGPLNIPNLKPPGLLRAYGRVQRTSIDSS